jgi:hypothetical protein
MYNYSDGHRADHFVSYSDFETGRHDRPSKEQRLSFQKRTIRRELRTQERALRRQCLRDLRSLTLRSDCSFQSKNTMQNTLQAGQASEYPGLLGQATPWTVRQDKQTTFVVEVADDT